MRTVASDLRFAARMLLKSPGFTLVAIVSLALGIGANTAIFSLIDSVMLRTLPVSHPEQLMFVNTNAVQVGQISVSRTITWSALKHMQEHATTVASLCSADSGSKVNVESNGQAELAAGQFVSGNFFSMLGVPALLGKTFDASDDHPDGRAAVLGFGYWQRRFGGDPTVIGRSITINNVPFRIVAVTPREFYGTSMDQPSDITMPGATQPQVEDGQISSKAPKPADAAGFVFVRMKSGVPISKAAAELTVLFRQGGMDDESSESENTVEIQKYWIELTPASKGFNLMRSRFSEPLKVLMVVVGLVMLIACANIANLLLARASARQREIAIRLSLGSSRWRLVRQLLTESLLLSVLGGALGILFAMWARDGIIYLANVDGTIPAAWNFRVFGFTAAVCVLNALLFGIAPALRATGVDFAAALKAGRTARTTGRLPIARILVATQVSLSLALLVGAGLFLNTFRNLDRADLGFDRGHELMITLDPTLAGYKGAAIADLYRQVLERVGGVPGVRSASLTNSRLMGSSVMLSGVSVPGYTLRKGEDPHNLWVISNQVGAGFFDVSGMHLASGRDFLERDNATGPKVAVINETMAKHFFDGRDPIGQRIEGAKNEASTIVGVVRDIKIFGPREVKQDVMFTPLLQLKEEGSATVLIRTTVDPLRVAAGVRAAIRSVEPKLPQFDVITMDQQVANSLSQPRLLAILASTFGALALSLAVIGLYGVLSYGVMQRTGEIGLRMALGAQSATILKMILGETTRLVALGIVVGVGVAIAGARMVKSMLYGVAPADAWSIGIAVVILSAAALLAGFLPARRASRVDPMVALRNE